MLALLASIALASPGVLPRGDQLALARLTAFDREMAGLLDSYLGAVPECPPLPDTPMRRWDMDLAWIRAGLARRSVLWTAWFLPDVETRRSLKHYLSACDLYMSCYAGMLESYRGGGLPDPAAAIALEDGLFEADSAWADSGASLFGLMEEKHWP
jgi:hypothetical protein